MAFIYGIKNKINNKLYIGKTTYSLDKRFKEHKRDSTRNSKEVRPLYRAFRKYGIENFEIFQIEECNIEALSDREIY